MFLNVIDNDFCVGCGTCAYISSEKIKMGFDRHGKYKALIKEKITERDKKLLNNICPFSSNSKNETEISKKIFSQVEHQHQKIGFYISLFSGYWNKKKNRITSSSGGLTTWLLQNLLDKKLIDGVIHVGNLNSNELLFGYKISYTKNDILSNSKTRYYPIELSNVLSKLDKQKKYAIVGIPCFIKAMRLLAENDKTINQLIKYYIGIVCGHLKSKHFTSAIALQNKIESNNITDIDYRNKISDKKANLYGARIEYLEKDISTTRITKPLNTFFGSDWGFGFYKYKACDYCDDVLNETADIVFGDAWIEPYISDWKGHNIVIIRNQLINELFKEGSVKNEIIFNKLSENEIIKTQASSFRHRTEGLSYRLFLDRRHNRWFPKKRVNIHNNISLKRKIIYILRKKISIKSHKAILESIEKQNIKILTHRMKPIVTLYRVVNRGIKVLLPQRFRSYIKKMLK